MTCAEARLLVDPYIDGELELMRSLEVEQHLDSCAACAKAAAGLRTMRSGIANANLYYAAPPEFESRIRAISRRSDRRPAEKRRLGSWLGAGFAAAAILLIGLFLGNLLKPNAGGDDLIAREVVADHVRSLMVGHLTDVLSSNQHTVKPWFEGKLDFSPMVVDLAAEGFPLIGGRLDYLGGHPVAAIVYRHGGHPINLFVSPSPNTQSSPPVTDTRNGYNVIHWNEHGDSYWAVSSANTEALNEFVTNIRKPPASKASR